MVSLIYNVLNAIRSFVPRKPPLPDHCAFLPSIIHRTLDQSFMQQFEEVLVIGDIHGCFDELKLLLEKANAFDDKILKIFVGDLVNKGPKNEEVLTLVQGLPSMVAVRGNHDEVILDEYYNSQRADHVMRPENAWIPALKIEHINFLQDLPYTISIPSLNTIIVHAGLVPGYPLELNNKYAMVHMRNIVITDYFWDGGLYPTENISYGEPWGSLWGGPEHVYFGHDAKRMLQIYPFATGLDTGCVYGNWLTGLFISGPRKGQFLRVDALKVHQKGKG